MLTTGMGVWQLACVCTICSVSPWMRALSTGCSTVQGSSRVRGDNLQEQEFGARKHRGVRCSACARAPPWAAGVAGSVGAGAVAASTSNAAACAAYRSRVQPCTTRQHIYSHVQVLQREARGLLGPAGTAGCPRQLPALTNQLAATGCHAAHTRRRRAQKTENKEKC